jgi:hypothetical protein
MFNQMIKSYRWMFIEKNWRWVVAIFLGFVLMDILYGLYLRSPHRSKKA